MGTGTPMFENAQKGEKVYCLMYGWGEITRIHSGTTEYPIDVQFENENHCYSKGGFWMTRDVNQTLFYVKPEIIVPKRKVEVELDVWLNIYDDEPKPSIHLTEAAAIARCSECSTHKAVPAKLTYTIEL